MSFHVYREILTCQTRRQNLTDIEKTLEPYLEEQDVFHLEDVTDTVKEMISRSRVMDGMVLVQSCHTSATISVNEYNEPLLSGDLARKMRELIPVDAEYLHHSPLRTKNLGPDGINRDRNGPAHLKAMLFGAPSVTLAVMDGMLKVGSWQRVCLIDFDGPRERNLVIQIMGNT